MHWMLDTGYRILVAGYWLLIIICFLVFAFAFCSLPLPLSLSFVVQCMGFVIFRVGSILIKSEIFAVISSSLLKQQLQE
jgi:hypothetical protein